MNRPRLLAETIGTFMLVVIGPGAAAVNLHTQGAVSHVGVALSFAFVIVAGGWTAHWLYWLGPLLGSGLGVLIYGYLRKGEAHDYRSEPSLARTDPLHRQLGPEPDGRGGAEPERTRPVRR
jgi:glycerol uptake facilitator-like aquaporin